MENGKRCGFCSVYGFWRSVSSGVKPLYGRAFDAIWRRGATLLGCRIGRLTWREKRCSHHVSVTVQRLQRGR